jgi:DNA-binding NarL/FixJ family response regulator
MTVTVVIVDDHQVVRQGLRAMFERETDIQIVGEASNGWEAIEETIRKKPQVLVLDLVLPDTSGLLVTREVRLGCPETKIVIFSMYSDDAHVLGALRAGALGYVLKGAASEELLSAVRAAAADRKFLSSELARRATEAYGRDDPGEETDTYKTISLREQEILELVANGMTTREIASLLSLSPRTVQVHRVNLMRKLDFHSQVDLVRYALSKGIIPPRS